MEQSPRVERKLAALLSADVKGFSRLMGEDEEATLRTLTASRQVTVEKMEAIARLKKAAEKTVRVPIWDFAEVAP